VSTARMRTDERFALVPIWVLDSDISDRAARLYAVLSKMADADTGIAWPSRQYLATRIRSSKKSVDRALGELEKLGAVTVERGRQTPEGSPRPNVYTVWKSSPVTRGRGTSAPGGGRATPDPRVGPETTPKGDPVNDLPPLPPPSGGDGEADLTTTSPQTTTTQPPSANPRARGTNPRAIGDRERTKREAKERDAAARALGQRLAGSLFRDEDEARSYFGDAFAGDTPRSELALDAWRETQVQSDENVVAPI